MARRSRGVGRLSLRLRTKSPYSASTLLRTVQIWKAPFYGEGIWTTTVGLVATFIRRVIKVRSLAWRRYSQRKKSSNKAALTNPLPLRSRSLRMTRTPNHSRRRNPGSGWQAFDVLQEYEYQWHHDSKLAQLDVFDRRIVTLLR